MDESSRMTPARLLEQMLTEKKTYDLDGNERRITGSINEVEASFIQETIKSRRLTRCVETGVAYGCSTVAICQALSELSHLDVTCKHWGVDPCQLVEFNGAAVAALRRCGLDHLFELLEGPSHLMLPTLIKRGETVDMVFVDGWHTFDYTLVDVFLADKLLRPGGILIMHDMGMLSKQKVWRYLCSHRKYRRLPGPMRPLSRRVLSFGKNTLSKGLRCGLANLTQSLLLVAEKMEDFEPDHSFFKDF